MTASCFEPELSSSSHAGTQGQNRHAKKSALPGSRAWSGTSRVTAVRQVTAQPRNKNQLPQRPFLSPSSFHFSISLSFPSLLPVHCKPTKTSSLGSLCVNRGARRKGPLPRWGGWEEDAYKSLLQFERGALLVLDRPVRARFRPAIPTVISVVLRGLGLD